MNDTSLRAALLATSHHKAPPLRLPLAAGELTIEAVLRRLPEKRVVLKGEFDGRPVIAKFFLDGRRAKVHAAREQDGLKQLHAAGVPAPQLVATTSAGDDIPVLLTAFLADSASLLSRWPQADEPQKSAWLGELAGALARLHAHGCRHDDLHFGNVLVTPGGLVVLDGDAVSPCQSEAAALDNLALLLAQLPALDRPLAEPAWRAYAQQRGLSSLDFAPHLRAVSERRLRKILNKMQRDCAAVRTRSRFGHWFASTRELGSHPEWDGFIANPDQWFIEPRAQYLKRGNSATVVRTRLVDRDVVIKRYNIKNPLHGLMLGLRPTSRARNAWCFAWLLELLGLSTPAPLAVLETRFGFWKRKAYLVTDWTSARDCREVLAEAADAGLPARIGAAIRALADIGVSHGDLKASNVLVDTDGVPVFIDLDSMALHAKAETLQPAVRQDHRRFLANWREGEAPDGLALSAD